MDWNFAEFRWGFMPSCIEDVFQCDFTSFKLPEKQLRAEVHFEEALFDLDVELTKNTYLNMLDTAQQDRVRRFLFSSMHFAYHTHASINIGLDAGQGCFLVFVRADVFSLSDRNMSFLNDAHQTATSIRITGDDHNSNTIACFHLDVFLPLPPEGEE